MIEWRDGRLMDDDEIEKYYQFCERRRVCERLEKPGIYHNCKDMLAGFSKAIIVGMACSGVVYLLWRIFR